MHKHYPALDGIRGLAVLFVLVGHFIPFRLIGEVTGRGDTGVVIFFCLSGFLITSILLEAKSRAHGFGQYISVFYGRRVLRIFPIYYLTVILAFVVGYGPVRENIVRLLSYTGNYIPGLPWPQLGSASHLWSLSVEEQFYVLWPLIVFFCTKRRLPRVLATLVIAVVAAKYAGALFASGLAVDDPAAMQAYGWLFRTLPSCVDSLGAGAALAIIKYRTNTASTISAPLIGRRAALAILALFAAVTLYRLLLPVDPYYRGNFVFGVLYFHAVIGASLVALDYGTSKGVALFNRAFTNPVMTYTGKISYGLYIYHFFLMGAVSLWLGQQHSMAMNGLKVLLLFAGSYLVATLSYFAIERPLLNLKRRFAYDRGKEAPEPSALPQAEGASERVPRDA